MEYITHAANGKQIAEITTSDVHIHNAQDFLDLTANVAARTIVIKKEMLDESFFDLKSGVAGDILQKVSTYRLQLGIIGDFCRYTSKSLQAFIYESNQTGQVLFVDTILEAIKRFSVK